MRWHWVGRRRLTIAFIAFFTSWYALQLAVAHSFGQSTAVWWFYFTPSLSPGNVLATVSHDMSGLGHLRRNVFTLAIVGGLAEPYLKRNQYAKILLGISFVSIASSEILSVIFGTQWILAGPSGGIYGMWAFIGVKNRFMILDKDSQQSIVESASLAIGTVAIVVIPIFDVIGSGSVNTSHVLGILLGYYLAIGGLNPTFPTKLNRTS